MFRAVITLTMPPGNRRKTTNARRPSSVSPNAMYRFWRARLTLWVTGEDFLTIVSIRIYETLRPTRGVAPEFLN
jgi:hypothetical protein